ncbi:hypothetical protein KY334_01575 [Candidatus Woesearchaeota archaeon]|nr:hypothetical protein [Candidatus Woesearchaeota archaeon]
MTLEDELIREPNLIVKLFNKNPFKDKVRAYISDYFENEWTEINNIDYEVSNGSHLALIKSHINNGTYSLKVEYEGSVFERKFTYTSHNEDPKYIGIARFMLEYKSGFFSKKIIERDKIIF